MSITTTPSVNTTAAVLAEGEPPVLLLDGTAEGVTETGPEAVDDAETSVLAEPARAPWSVKQRLACVIVRPLLLEQRLHAETAEEQYVPALQGRSFKFAQPLGFTFALAVDVLAFILTFFLPRDLRMAKQLVATANETLRRIEFYVEADADGLPILRSQQFRPQDSPDDCSETPAEATDA